MVDPRNHRFQDIFFVVFWMIWGCFHFRKPILYIYVMGPVLINMFFFAMVMAGKQWWNIWVNGHIMEVLWGCKSTWNQPLGGSRFLCLLGLESPKWPRLWVASYYDCAQHYPAKIRVLPRWNPHGETPMGRQVPGCLEGGLASPAAGALGCWFGMHGLERITLW